MTEKDEKNKLIYKKYSKILSAKSVNSNIKYLL